MVLKASKHLNALCINNIHTFSLCTYIFSLSNISIFSQDNSNTIQNESLAIEKVVIEEYSIPSLKNLAATDLSPLPDFFTTYKIFIQIKAGYNFQLIYGEKKHGVFIKTSAKFQNNKVYRALTSFNINPRINAENFFSSDTWVTMGSSTKIHLDIYKSNTTDSDFESINIFENDRHYSSEKLQLNKPFKSDLNYFNDENPDNAIIEDNGNQDIYNKSTNYAEENRILIAQLTTKEKLNFELDVLIGKSSANCLHFHHDDAEKRNISIS